MNNKVSFIAYLILVTTFSVLFKYGIHISFKIDTGFVGPVFIFHALVIIAALVNGTKNEDCSI